MENSINQKRICVIGAGIVGLSCGVRLKEVLGVSYDVVIIADKFPLETHSAIAAGSFKPTFDTLVDGYYGPRKSISR